MQQPSWTSRTFLVQSSRRDTSTSSGTQVTSPSCLDERGGGMLACLQVGPHLKTTLHQKRHFAEYELAITDLNLFLEKLHTGAFNETLFVTHASRSDIVTGYLVYAATYERMTGKAMQGGILLSGSPSTPFGAWPDQALRKCIESSSVPILFTHVSTSETVKKLTKYVAKLNADDPSRTDSVVNQYSKHINEDKLLEVAGWKGN
mmetsp:Transcript_21324/g.48101  ORF Transcript_21324/g.48101 Transcript_21324/m.48101 type:complete len:204 (-) Transcript_21324:265-876(-)